MDFIFKNISSTKTASIVIPYKRQVIDIQPMGSCIIENLSGDLLTYQNEYKLSGVIVEEYHKPEVVKPKTKKSKSK